MEFSECPMNGSYNDRMNRPRIKLYVRDGDGEKMEWGRG